jgi:hypothetical protein
MQHLKTHASKFHRVTQRDVLERHPAVDEAALDACAGQIVGEAFAEKDLLHLEVVQQSRESARVVGIGMGEEHEVERLDPLADEVRDNRPPGDVARTVGPDVDQRGVSAG